MWENLAWSEIPFKLLLGKQTITQYVDEQHRRRPWRTRWDLFNEAIDHLAEYAHAQRRSHGLG